MVLILFSCITQLWDRNIPCVKLGSVDIRLDAMVIPPFLMGWGGNPPIFNGMGS